MCVSVWLDELSKETKEALVDPCLTTQPLSHYPLSKAWNQAAPRCSHYPLKLGIRVPAGHALPLATLTAPSLYPAGIQPQASPLHACVGVMYLRASDQPRITFSAAPQLASYECRTYLREPIILAPK